MRETDDPLTPWEAVDLDDPDRPVPVCPMCGVLMRQRADNTGNAGLACDLHGWQPPEWTTEGGNDE